MEMHCLHCRGKYNDCVLVQKYFPKDTAPAAMFGGLTLAVSYRRMFKRGSLFFIYHKCLKLLKLMKRFQIEWVYFN